MDPCGLSDDDDDERIKSTCEVGDVDHEEISVVGWTSLKFVCGLSGGMETER